MKNRYLLMLLSVLLCIAMLFTACAKASDEDEETTTEPEETTTEPEETLPPVEVEPEITDKVEPILENFFKFDVVDTTVLGTVERFEGESVARFEDVVIMKESSINAKNKITEVFTVYNVNEEEPVLTLKNKYDNGDFLAFDWDDLYITEDEFTSNGTNPDGFKYPENVMKVSIRELSDTAVIEVATAKVKALEVDLEENPNGNYFEIKTEYAYYDLFGTLINKTSDKVRALSATGTLSEDGNIYRVSIGNVTAYLDANTGKLIKTVSTDNAIKYAGYDVQTTKYGFYMDQKAQAPLGTSRTYFEAYNKQTGELVIRYYLDTADAASAFVLRNGNVLIQYENLLPHDSTHEYDIEFMGMRMKLDTYVLNIETGALTEIDANYIVGELIPNNEWANTERFVKNNGVTLTENVVNLAEVVFIKENKQVDLFRDAQLAVLNNDGSVMYAMENIIPEHDINFYNDLGVRTLKTGDLLVDLTSAAPAPYAIVSKDGAVRCYLNEGESVVGQYIVTEKGIYDFDKKLVQTFDDWNDYTLLAIFGDSILCYKEVTYMENDLEETRNDYYIVDATSSTIYFNSLTTAEDAELTVVEQGKDYIVLHDAFNGRYTMYNAKMAHLLTTNDSMTVNEITTGYVVSTNVDGETLYYTVA